MNRLDEPVFIAVSKPLLTEFGIHCSLESCEPVDLIDTSICHCCHSFNAIGKLSLDAMMAEMTVREWYCHMERGPFSLSMEQ